MIAEHTYKVRVISNKGLSEVTLENVVEEAVFFDNPSIVFTLNDGDTVEIYTDNVYLIYREYHV